MKTHRATVSFKTVGCRLNQAETATIRASFEEAGFETVPFGAPCDICVIHGCVVTSKAEEDSARLVRSIKRRYPNTFVVLAGCAAELAAKNKGTTSFCHSREGGNPVSDILDSRLHGNDKLVNTPDKQSKCDISTRESADADYLAGQSEKFNLPDILSPAGLSQRTEARNLAPPRFNTKRAIVKIQDGCDFRCSYCIVPGVRGQSRSRPAAEIIEEITRLALCGFPETVLTGANIGCYNEGGLGLAQLLEKVEAIPSLKRFRISSLEISTNERGVIDFMASSHKMCRSLHLPLQSGSNRILKAMGRRYTAEKYCAIVEYAQKRLGGFGLGTDIIVGFPGETEDDFKETEQLVRQLPFTKLHVFGYSPRPGTPAASMPEQLTGSARDARVALLIELGLEKRKTFAQILTGKRLCLVVEKVKDGWAEGWTGEYMWARVRSNHLKPKQTAEFACEDAEGDILIGSC